MDGVGDIRKGIRPLGDQGRECVMRAAAALGVSDRIRMGGGGWYTARGDGVGTLFGRQEGRDMSCREDMTAGVRRMCMADVVRVRFVGDTARRGTA